jgi:hypothetical protein
MSEGSNPSDGVRAAWIALPYTRIDGVLMLATVILTYRDPEPDIA